MRKIQLIKTVMLGLCLSTLYTGVTYANTIDNKAAEVTIKDIAPGTDLSKLQSDIDQYVFTDHTADIEKQGFQVTQTVVTNGYVEIGITPFSDENANYLYDLFGKDNVKVVKSDEVKVFKTTEAVAPDTPVSSEAADNSLVKRQDEVNKVLFEDKSSDLESKGISIMHTTPVEDYIEVGILPYNDENVKYIYSLTGEDKVKVVEGKEPELMATSGIATDGEMTATEEGNVKTVSATDTTAGNKEKESENILPIAGVAAVAVLIGGAVVISQKKKIA
ncbi:hypothetical protein [Anaerocolumna chitinilytica]|uniref:Uncharacterized protein n=1 Tax=Anaerocolumna chitinilytica TaxID=1727145 RepID=A0A7I8DMY8_9FIRM|nr:hypothetical protein [Anaerocolumna chitinilytica]BCJ99778.1 hypothetical protein bsdcttw_28190 [Anaerocolumna chitinilytica]